MITQRGTLTAEDRGPIGITTSGTGSHTHPRQVRVFSRLISTAEGNLYDLYETRPRGV